MPRRPIGAEAMSPAQRQAKRRRQFDHMRDTLRHVADAIQHARELGAHWSPAQRQAYLNAAEAAARRAIAASPEESTR